MLMLGPDAGKEIAKVPDVSVDVQGFVLEKMSIGGKSCFAAALCDFCNMFGFAVVR